MTKTQIFLQNFCHGQICCLKTLESRKKPAKNKQTAKAVCYLSRYSYSTVYDRVTEKWSPKYPNSMKRWKDNWDAISPIFKFSTTVRTVIYTTNAIESLNSTYRKLNRQRSVFPSDTALLKALYLATFEATKKWTSTIRNWAQVYGELSIMYEGRLPE